MHYVTYEVRTEEPHNLAKLIGKVGTARVVDENDEVVTTAIGKFVLITNTQDDKGRPVEAVQFDLAAQALHTLGEPDLHIIVSGEIE